MLLPRAVAAPTLDAGARARKQKSESLAPVRRGVGLAGLQFAEGFPDQPLGGGLVPTEYAAGGMELGQSRIQRCLGPVDLAVTALRPGAGGERHEANSDHDRGQFEFVLHLISLQAKAELLARFAVPRIRVLSTGHRGRATLGRLFEGGERHACYRA